jgi:antitoxin MazE
LELLGAADPSVPLASSAGLVYLGSYSRTNEVVMMVKKLSAVGNSLGLIIDRPILELLDITKDTPLEIKTDGEALIIRPMKKANTLDRALAAADELMNAHDETYRKLAK